MSEFALPMPKPCREHSPETKAQIAAIAARREARQRHSPKPVHWLKPAYGSAQYRYALAVNWITEEEHKADYAAFQARQQRAREARGARSSVRPRDHNPAPLETRQYGRDFGTEGLRDARLTPNARNLLMLIRARCGDALETAFTKGTMANVLGVSARSIQRYVQELIRFGYIVAEVRRGWRGLHTGLVVRICEKVRPFYARPAMRAAWLKEETARIVRKAARTLANAGRTGLSPTKKTQINLEGLWNLEAVRNAESP